MDNQIEDTQQVNQIQKIETVGQLNEVGLFELMQRQSKVFASSQIVPQGYRDNMPNCFIALDIAKRLNANPMTVMQNLYIVHGKPAWSATFIIAGINSSGKYSPLRFQFAGEGKTRSCICWANELATGERLESSMITMAMADAEGWSTKAGSKWKTMPDQMLMYRSATFFGRIYSPEVLMGLSTSDEVVDIRTSEKSMKIAEPAGLDEDDAIPMDFDTPPPQEREGEAFNKKNANLKAVDIDAPVKPKRKRRTKAEIEAEKKAEIAKEADAVEVKTNDQELAQGDVFDETQIDKLIILLKGEKIQFSDAQEWARSLGQDIQDEDFCQKVVDRWEGSARNAIIGYAKEQE